MNDFESWEKSLGDIPEMSNLPTNQIENMVKNSSDPIRCAMDIHDYIQNASPEAQESFIREANDGINYRFTYMYLNRPVYIRVDEAFDISGHSETSDMMEMLIVLKRDGEVLAGGKMAFFEKHYYLDAETGEKLPRISLRLHSPAFLDPEKDTENQSVSMPNYLTVPISAISYYEIRDRDD